jgi:hypothetical protein
MVESHPLKAVFACQQCGVYNASKKLLANHKKVESVVRVCDIFLSATFFLFCDTVPLVIPHL